MGQAISAQTLQRENGCYQGTGGVDGETAAVYLSRFADGQPAPFHLLDGLPEDVVLSRNPTGRVAAVKQTLVSGFVLDGCFYTREQAASKVADLN